MTKYFLYARKSTDDKDKQIHSIQDQVTVLRKLAKKEGFNIVQEFEERQTAKVPGRPIFSDMLRRIEKGEAQGILCWEAWTRTRILAFKGRCPTIRRPPSSMRDKCRGSCPTCPPLADH